MIDLDQHSSLGSALREALDAFANETCLIEADRDRERTRLTYSDFKQMALPLARALQDAEFQPNDRCAIVMTNQSKWLISAYGYGKGMEEFRAAYAQWGAWIILIKGLTPIPYKIVTITSGFADYNLGLFILFSIITRGARFFVLAFLLHRYGESARHIIEKRLGLWVLLGAIVIVIGLVGTLYLF